MSHQMVFIVAIVCIFLAIAFLVLHEGSIWTEIRSFRSLRDTRIREQQWRTAILVHLTRYPLGASLDDIRDALVYPCTNEDDARFHTCVRELCTLEYLATHVAFDEEKNAYNRYRISARGRAALHFKDTTGTLCHVNELHEKYVRVPAPPPERKHRTGGRI